MEWEGKHIRPGFIQGSNHSSGTVQTSTQGQAGSGGQKRYRGKSAACMGFPQYCRSCCSTPPQRTNSAPAPSGTVRGI
jgi:hypothetical protein